MSTRQATFGVGIIVVACLCWGSLVELGRAAVPLVTVTVDTNAPGSVTVGIQEAIDKLPESGGEVLLPVGVYEVQSTIYMKPDTTLRGFGAGSIIRKSPGLRALLAEDVLGSSTQNYVVVKSAAGLRPKMSFLLGDLGRADAHVFIDRIEGNRVFLHQGAGQLGAHFRPASLRYWKPSGDLKMAKEAALYNGFMLIQVSCRCVISSLALDGNRAAQGVDGKDRYKDYPNWWERLRCAPYLKGDSRIEHCRVYGAAGVGISLGSRATVFNCDIADTVQGIHPGAGPYSRIIQNTIHHNDWDGIGMCLGNYGLIISQNHIYENRRSGIGELGDPLDRPGRCADHFTIISDNVIYRNGAGGIQSGQGIVGPADFVITGNIVMNNWQSGSRRLGKHMMPAGISLYNAKRCVVANNRVFDDQDWYPVELAEPVAAGATKLGPLLRCPNYGMQVPLFDEPAQKEHYFADGMSGYTNFVALISGNGRVERHRITGWRWNGELMELRTAEPLLYDYRQSMSVLPEQARRLLGPIPARHKDAITNTFATITPEKTQLWGVFIGGPESAENVVANNLCVDNRIGGILWSGRDMAVNGNVGSVVMLDTNRSLVENVYPFRDVPLPNGGFEEDGGWQLGARAAYAAPGYTGTRSLKIMATTGAAVIVRYEKGALPVKPDTDYRLTAWVKSGAQRGDKPAWPRLYLLEADGTGKTVSTAASSQSVRTDFEKDPMTTGQWVRVVAEGRTGPAAAALWIEIRLNKDAEGEVWVDEVRIQESEDTARPPGVPSDKERPRMESRAGTGPAEDARIELFYVRDGRVTPGETRASSWWDRETLRFRFVCADTDPAGLRARVADSTAFRWSDDVVAVLLQPNVYNDNLYYQFGVSAAGATFSQVCGAYGRSDVRECGNPVFRSEAILTESGWTAELTILLAELTPVAPAPGDVWGVQLGRVARWPAGKELSAWPRSEDWHAVDAFGRLVFAR